MITFGCKCNKYAVRPSQIIVLFWVRSPMVTYPKTTESELFFRYSRPIGLVVLTTILFADYKVFFQMK